MAGQCDSCDTTDTGCKTCNTCQSLYQLGPSSNNEFSFSKCVAKDEIIGPPIYNENGINIAPWFTRDTWNEAIKRINEIYLKGAKQNAKDYTIDLNTSDKFMTFAEYKRVAEAIDYEYPKEIKQNAVMYGKYFSDLANAIASMNYIEGQCEICNSSCNSCESCEECNAECDTCDSGCCETTEEDSTV